MNLKYWAGCFGIRCCCKLMVEIIEIISPLYPAFDEIRRQIEQAGIVMANASNENDIVSFAQH